MLSMYVWKQASRLHPALKTFNMKYASVVAPGQEAPGDLLFERGTSLAAAAIRFSQLSSINHTGILIRPHSTLGHWWIAEADDKGFRIKVRNLAVFGGYIARMPGDQGPEIVLAARHLASRKMRYSWGAIVWQAGRFFQKWWPTYAFGMFLKRLFRPEQERKRMICSEAVLYCLREVDEWPELISRFNQMTGFEVSPVDLWRAVIGHRDG